MTRRRRVIGRRMGGRSEPPPDLELVSVATAGAVPITPSRRDDPRWRTVAELHLLAAPTVHRAISTESRVAHRRQSHQLLVFNYIYRAAGVCVAAARAQTECGCRDAGCRVAVRRLPELEDSVAWSGTRQVRGPRPLPPRTQ